MKFKQFLDEQVKVPGGRMDFAVTFKNVKDRDAFIEQVKTANFTSTMIFNPKTMERDRDDKKNLCFAFDTWISTSRWVLKAAVEKYNGTIVKGV